MRRATYWMCHVRGTAPPSQKHYRKAEAVAEAERLARDTNEEVFLLEAREFVAAEPPQPPVLWHDTTTYPRN